MTANIVNNEISVFIIQEVIDIFYSIIIMIMNPDVSNNCKYIILNAQSSSENGFFLLVSIISNFGGRSYPGYAELLMKRCCLFIREADRSLKESLRRMIIERHKRRGFDAGMSTK